MQPAHPLEPLATGELERAAALARGAVDGARFVSIGLHEPPKAEYLAWLDGGPRPARRALAIVVDRERRVQRGRVRPRRAAPSSRTPRSPGARSPITPEDYEAAAEAVRADAGWREALRRRGIDDVSLVQIDVLASGGFGLDVERGRRVARAVAYLREHAGDNGYAHPIESLIAYVDVDECRVLELEELDVKPIPAADGAYGAGTVPVRDDLRPIEIAQPEGVSFTVEGNAISWYRWSLRAALDPQEGLVLHDVRFDGRPVLHRASCAEMIVPYGEPHPMHAWRTYFDAGEYGLGACTNSLALGCDCVGEIRYLDAAPRRSRRPPAHARERHLPARGGRGPALEAQRRARGARRGAPGAPLRRQLDGDGRQLRLRVPLVLRPRRLDRVRGAAARHRLDDGARARRAARREHDRRRRARGAEPPALLLLPPRPRRRRRRQQRARGRVGGGSRRARRIRSATPSARASRRSRASPRRGATATSALRASGTSSTPRGATASAARPATGSCRSTGSRRCSPSRTRASRAARASRATRSGSRRHEEAERHPSGRYPYGAPETDRPTAVERGRPLARGDRRRALVHRRHDALRASGGLADDAGRPRRLPAGARRVLRPQPVARHPAAARLPRGDAAPR